MPRVLLSITTTPAATTLQDKAQEIRDLNLQQIALFITGLKEDERREYLDTLATIPNLTLPFVHARSDMYVSEYDRLINEFGTERFNLHPIRELQPIEELPQRLRDIIYIENTKGLHREDLEGFAGICLDVSHLENFRQLNPPIYTEVTGLLDSFPIGANHMSACLSEPTLDIEGKMTVARHDYIEPSNYDYLKRYPLRYFTEYAAIELTNPLKEQLSVKAYIEKILAEKSI